MAMKLTPEQKKYLEQQIREIAQFVRRNIKMGLVDAARNNTNKINCMRKDLGLEDAKSPDDLEEGLPEESKV